jgi:hypothetical protein
MAPANKAKAIGMAISLGFIQYLLVGRSQSAAFSTASSTLR